MKLRKYEKLRLLYNGDTKLVTCKYVENIYKDIPLFKSEDAINIQIVKLASDEVLVIINDNMYDMLKRFKANNKLDKSLEIFIMYSILEQQHNQNEKNDLCLAYWFGFKTIINMVNYGNIGDATKDRINKLETELVTQMNSKNVPSIKDFLKNISFIEVEV